MGPRTARRVGSTWPSIMIMNDQPEHHQVSSARVVIASAAIVCTVVLAVITVSVGRKRAMVEADLAKVRVDLDAQTKRLEDQRSMYDSYSSFIERSQAQRELIIKDLANFEREKIMLEEKTRGLDRVEKNLDKLKAEAARLDKARRDFEHKLSILQRSVGR